MEVAAHGAPLTTYLVGRPVQLEWFGLGPGALLCSRLPLLVLLVLLLRLHQLHEDMEDIVSFQQN